jgi:hypothetical protein
MSNMPGKSNAATAPSAAAPTGLQSADKLSTAAPTKAAAPPKSAKSPNNGIENVSRGASTRRIAEQIDELVYGLYGLTPEEIQIVELASAPASARQKGAAK